MNTQRWFLIDGNNVVNRDAHAGGVDRAASMTVNRIKLLREKFRSGVFIALWDSGRTFRHQLIGGYKSGRSKLDGIDNAIVETKQRLTDLAIPSFAADEFEADDLIATIAAQVRASGHNVVIYSTDKDLHQLLERDHICQIISASAAGGIVIPEWFNHDDMAARFKIEPCQWVDYRCLTGDDSDTVKGVESIGPAGAADLLNKFGSLDVFFGDVEQNRWKSPLTSKQTKRLIAAREQIELLQRIFKLRIDAPLPDYWLEAV